MLSALLRRVSAGKSPALWYEMNAKDMNANGASTCCMPLCRDMVSSQQMKLVEKGESDACICRGLCTERITKKSQRIEAKSKYLRTPRNAQAREPYGARVKCETKSEAFVHAVA